MPTDRQWDACVPKADPLGIRKIGDATPMGEMAKSDIFC
jgi:hypothetical protein